MELKVGDKIVCKLELELNGIYIYPKSKHVVTDLMKIGGYKYVLLDDNKAVWMGNIKTHFYTKKEMRKMKLDKINELK